MPTKKPSKLSRLLRDVIDAAFDCGEWRQHESGEEYEDLYRRGVEAEQKLRDYLKSKGVTR